MPPTSDGRLIHALHSQTAFVDGDPDTKEDLELYYYRLVCDHPFHRQSHSY